MAMTKTTRRQLRTIRRRRLALALAGVLAVPAVPAVAQNMPEAGSVVSGSATINNAGFELIINQASQGAIIDWGSFSIGAGYGVTFNQPNASAVILNRVVGLLGPGYAPSISNINGSLSANGNVFILNPSGVVFGNNGTSDQINVGGLIASTLWMNQGNFESSVANGTPWILFDNGVSTTSYVRNNGSIVAGAGGVGLVSPLVWNRGSITSNGGNILAGAGGQVTLDYDGDGLTQVTINVPSTRDAVIVQDRFGTMTADGGLVALRTAATTAGTGGVIYASGTIRAQTLSNVNGRVELTSNGGLVMLGAPGTFSDVTSSPFTEGHIDVSGGSNQTGGSVLVQGNSVLLVNNDATPFSPTNPLSVGSSIDASGGGSGGQVLIQSATSVLGLALSSIDARGVANGDGGTIDVLAFGGSALLLGTTTADAGKASGNGGRIRIGATDNVAVGQA
ncbi:MAG: filamentous hemagglutinin N-terminal domain-containing protein, partial [Lysobacteraceae bacterium]